VQGDPLEEAAGGVPLQIGRERCRVGVFGEGYSVTDKVFFDSGSQGMSLFTESGSVRLVSLHVNRLASAWGTGESTLDGNLAGPWSAANGTWTDTAAGKQGTAAGDAYYLSSSTGTDFTYEGDVRIDSATAAALTFRDQYSANVDATGMVKLWRPGRVIATYATPISTGRTYHLRVVAAGPRFQVYLDRSPQPVIDATDTASSSGQLGVNVFNGQATFNNLQVNAPGFATNVNGPWHPVNGTWTSPGTALQSRGAGDTFYLSSTTGTDFTYEGDLTPVNGVAAGLVFRANADGTQHYTANVDVNGLVKLWRPGKDIATYATPITPGRTYHLTVTTHGTNIRVALNGTEVINATDTTYASGLFGLNSFSGTARFTNVHT